MGFQKLFLHLAPTALGLRTSFAHSCDLKSTPQQVSMFTLPFASLSPLSLVRPSRVPEAMPLEFTLPLVVPGSERDLTATVSFRNHLDTRHPGYLANELSAGLRIKKVSDFAREFMVLEEFYMLVPRELDRVISPLLLVTVRPTWSNGARG